ncbi:biotin synthase [Desulfitispora alkaliphila]
MLKELLSKLNEQNNLTYDEIVYIIKHLDQESEQLLFQYANETRKKHCGLSVYMRGLIEFSNFCRCNCHYCGLRVDNKKIERYRLSEAKIMDCCEVGYQLGYRTFVLQSGEDPYYTKAVLGQLIKKIKDRFPDVAITLSVGERSFDEYKYFFDMGADRYLLRHETVSPKLYEELHQGMKLERRKECLAALKEIGYQVGAGFMVGLPGERAEDLAADLVFLKKLNPHMVGIGPFIPHEDTPLGYATGGTIEQTLVMIAMTRLLIPDALLPSTTAMGSLDPKGREKAIKAGANVVMPNLSPTDVRAKYELYKNKICLEDEAAHCRQCIEKRINSTGFKVNMKRGDSPRNIGN